MLRGKVMLRKMVFLGLLMFVSGVVFAEGLYFDIGGGWGKTTTRIEKRNIMDVLRYEGRAGREVAFDVGMKAGYRPIGNTPLYIVCELFWNSHRIANNKNYLDYNTFLIGPGVVYYLSRRIQLGASIGYSMSFNSTDMTIKIGNSYAGFAWNTTATLEIGADRMGLLVGVRYFSAYNQYKDCDLKQETHGVTGFLRLSVRER